RKAWRERIRPPLRRRRVPPRSKLRGYRPPVIFARGRCAEGMGEAHPVTVAAAPGSAPEQAPGLQRCAGAAAAEGGQRFLPPAMPPSTPRMIWLPTLVPTVRMADLVIASSAPWRRLVPSIHSLIFCMKPPSSPAGGGAVGVPGSLAVD